VFYASGCALCLPKLCTARMPPAVYAICSSCTGWRPHRTDIPCSSLDPTDHAHDGDNDNFDQRPPHFPTPLTLHPAGSLVAFGSSDRAVRLWDARAPRTSGEALSVKAYTAHKGWVVSLAWRPGSGHQLATASHDHTVKVRCCGAAPGMCKPGLHQPTSWLQTRTSIQSEVCCWHPSTGSIMHAHMSKAPTFTITAA